MLKERRLAAARRPQHDDVGFFDLGTAIGFIAVLHAFIVVVDGDGQDLLGAILMDDVLIQVFLNEMRLVLLQRRFQGGGKVFFVIFLHVPVVFFN